MIRFFYSLIFLSCNKTLLCLGLVFSSNIFAGEIIQSRVSYKNGVYEAWLEMQIAAPSKIVYALFTDFNQLTQLSDSITHSRLVSGSSPEYTVEIKSTNCALFFCIKLKQLQHVLELGDGHILVDDIKGKSDFKFSNTLWHIRTHKKGTRVSFSTSLEPDFWLPPLLGPWIFKDQLIEETRAMIERLEKLAKNENKPKK